MASVGARLPALRGDSIDGARIESRAMTTEGDEPAVAPDAAASGEKSEKLLKREAEKAMAAARKKLEVNYIDALGIQKEPYELEREALLVAGAQGVEAARESERGAAAGVGRIQLAQQKENARPPHPHPPYP